MSFKDNQKYLDETSFLKSLSGHEARASAPAAPWAPDAPASDFFFLHGDASIESEKGEERRSLSLSFLI